MDLTLVAIVLMLFAIAASIIPFVPGPALVWLIGVAYAALTGFARVTWVGVGVMTVFMLVGATAGWWMSALGMKAQGGSWLGVAGALVGGLIGTFAIPLPIVGTVVGMAAGAMLLEYTRARRVRAAIRAGGASVAAYLMGVFVEMAMSVLIFAVFIGSLIVGG